MSKAGAFLAGFGLAAVLGGATWWFVLQPKQAALEERAVSAERLALRAKRDATESRQWADAERKRKQEVEDELERVKRVLSASPPPAPMGHKAQPDREPLAPELWDRQTIGREIEELSKVSKTARASPRYGLLVRAIKAHPEESYDTLRQGVVAGLPPELTSVCATLLGALGDPRGVAPLIEAGRTAKDPDLRTAIIRSLANLPGDEQTPVLVAAWNEPQEDAVMHRMAIHGLARRKHEIALAVAAGTAPGGAKPAFRMQAMETLHSQAAAGEWKDATLVPVFGKALLSADGDPQRRVALTAIEGYWSKDSIAGLEAFADSSKTVELAARARKDADALRAGKPRPEGAGLMPKRPAMGTGAAPAAAEDPNEAATEPATEKTPQK